MSPPAPVSNADEVRRRIASAHSRIGQLGDDQIFARQADALEQRPLPTFPFAWTASAQLREIAPDVIKGPPPTRGSLDEVARFLAGGLTLVHPHRRTADCELVYFGQVRTVGANRVDVYILAQQAAIEYRR